MIRYRRTIAKFLRSLEEEMKGHCMFCGRGVWEVVGYCDNYCRVQYERSGRTR